MKSCPSVCLFFVALLLTVPPSAAQQETLPPLNGAAASGFEQMWQGFDPRSEPLETEVLQEWQQDGVALKVVRFRIGVFKGQPATLAAVYGLPQTAVGNKNSVPGLLQIHGGGQYADHKACVANAKRGYATLSIAWAGRISAPNYRVSPAEVRLFWDGRTDDPAYRVTTDWGAVDGYHAPGRNPGNSFPSASPAAWTLDDVESPRNSGWFLCALAARRGLTFLEQQPEVDPQRLGVYGHSMGGKLTVMTSVDERVKAAAPSCGGISDRYNRSPLFRRTIGDDVSLQRITCPIIFLSPANDFHGRLGDLPAAVELINSVPWRVTCSPHHNHQDTAEFEVATLLWFDQHLKDGMPLPSTPQTQLQLKTASGTPRLIVQPDTTRPVLSVDVFYTQQGQLNAGPEKMQETIHQFWHHAATTCRDDVWTAELPLHRGDQPLWAYANVRYELDEPVAGVGYYYGDYETRTFNLSSLVQTRTATEVAAADVRPTLLPTSVIEDFEGDWEQEWFTYRPREWARTTNKLHSGRYPAPAGARLCLDVQTEVANTLVVRLDQSAAAVRLEGQPQWQTVTLALSDFHDASGAALSSWNDVRQLELSAAETLRTGRGAAQVTRQVGGPWTGAPPQFRNLRWVAETTERR